jgi:predicted esterase
MLHVPVQASSDAAVPLAVMLHGAGGTADSMRFVIPFAAAHGCAVLAPAAQGPTWDAILDDFGADVQCIDAALAETFNRIAVDPRHFMLGGFSDGASYALSLGAINGDVFSHLVAFSPGFVTGTAGGQRPRVFVSHGTADEVLPIDRTSRVVVLRLRAAGYEVTYREFPGGHAVPAAIGNEAFSWFVA